MERGELVSERYQLDSLLGRGAMGEVWKALDRQTGQEVALKWMLASFQENPEARQRWRREADALDRLRHPNIVRLLDTASDYLVMEYLPGGSLRQRMSQFSQPTAILPLALDLSDALTRAHHLGIVHRDLKPENILFAENDSARLSDFGIAHLSGQATLTQEGALLGTIPYLSPEACQGSSAEPAQDIWSMGIILYELLLGKRPFAGQSAWELIQAIVGQPITHPRELRPELPQAWVELLLKLLNKDPSLRLRSARQLGAQLEELQEMSPRPSVDLQETQSLSARLPVASDSTPWTGRDQVLQQLHQALQYHSLVTLLSPGGMGKSRLAREYLARHLDQYPGGLHWVSLAPLGEQDSLPSALAQALHFCFAGELSPELQLGRRLQQLGKALLILDNCEHLTGLAHQLQGWLAICGEIKVLATSRRPLKLVQEHTLLLEPLSPQEGARLFSACCQRHGHKQPPNPAEVDRIVRATQGMPLALELAAGQLAHLNLAELAEELERSLELLDSGYLDHDQRERGLSCVFQSSWEHLDRLQQEQLVQLSYFRGGFSKAAAASVCQTHLPALVKLCEHSLVHRLPSGRYEVHEQIRQLALRRQPISPELPTRHAAFYCDWFAQLQKQIRSLSQPLSSILAAMEEEQGNLRLTWDWLAQNQRFDLWGEGWYGWLTHFDLSGRNLEFERQWLAPILVNLPPSPARGCWLLARAINLNRLGRGDEALDLFEEALELLKGCRTGQLGAADRAYGLVQRALITQNRDPALAVCREWVEEALPILQQTGFVTGLSLAYTALAVTAWARERDREASRNWAQQAIQQVGGDPHPTGRLNLHWAHLALAQGETEMARHHAGQGLELSGSVCDHYYHAYAQFLLGLADWQSGQVESACQRLLEALDESWQYRLLSICHQAVLGLALVFQTRGDLQESARLAGSLEPDRLSWLSREQYAQLCQKLSPALGGDFQAEVERTLERFRLTTDKS